ncbi:MAG: T9SS type A sorting domain-containing protein, partial [Bacteroidia bacterium]
SYSVTVTDVNGCSGNTTVTITQPTPLVAGITSHVNNKCSTPCRGKAFTTTSGGTAPYTYSWSSSFTTRDSATRLCTGTEIVTITDANGCSKTDSVKIGGPALPLTATTTQTNVKCYGGSTGSATATASGGTAPYTYSWVPNPLYFALKAGPEICTVTDSNGCTTNKFFNITQPPVINPTLYVTPATSSSASNGKDSVSVTGGTGGTYTYSWSPGTCNTNVCTGLAPGYYTVCVTDSNNCRVCKTDTLGVMGIVEMEAPSMFVFPNPAGDHLNIQAPAQYAIQSIELFNIQGILVYQRKDFKSGILDLNSLTPGTYLLRLNYQGGSMHKFFVKE